MKRLAMNFASTALGFVLIAVGSPLAEAATLSGVAVEAHITEIGRGPGKACKKSGEPPEIRVSSRFDEDEFEVAMLLGLDPDAQPSHARRPKTKFRAEMEVLVDILAAPGDAWILELDLLHWGSGSLRTELGVSPLGLGDLSTTVLSAEFGSGDPGLFPCDRWACTDGKGELIRHESASISGIGSTTIQIRTELKGKRVSSHTKHAPAHHERFETVTLSGRLRPVPEPSSALLLGLGVLALCGRRRS